VVRLSALEKIGALRGNIRVPLASVRAVRKCGHARGSCARDRSVVAEDSVATTVRPRRKWSETLELTDGAPRAFAARQDLWFGCDFVYVAWEPQINQPIAPCVNQAAQPGRRARVLPVVRSAARPSNAATVASGASIKAGRSVARPSATADGAVPRCRRAARRIPKFRPIYAGVAAKHETAQFRPEMAAKSSWHGPCALQQFMVPYI
jgi:hypothetical protein